MHTISVLYCAHLCYERNISCKDEHNKGQKWDDPDKHDGVITHLKPDILECEVKRALGSIITKLVEVMEFQLNYFKYMLL